MRVGSPTMRQVFGSQTKRARSTSGAQGPVFIDRMLRRAATYEGSVAFYLPGYADHAAYLAAALLLGITDAQAQTAPAAATI